MWTQNTAFLGVLFSYVTGGNRDILGVATQRCRNGELALPATMKRSCACNKTEVFPVVSRHIVIKFPNTKFCGKPSFESRANTFGQTDGHDESRRVFRDCERALKDRLLIRKDCRSERTIRRDWVCLERKCCWTTAVSPAYGSTIETRVAAISNISRSRLVKVVEMGWRDAKTGRYQRDVILNIFCDLQ